MFLKFLVLIVLSHSFVTCTRKENVLALRDDEYEVMLKKVLGNFQTPVAERSLIERTINRKYYRWIKEGKELSVGNSGKHIYIDGKRLLRKNELAKAVEKVIKEGKNPGCRTVAGRLKENIAGCSHNDVKKIKLTKMYSKVILYFNY